MAIVELLDFTAYVGSELVANQPNLQASLSAAEHAVQHHCRRRFALAATPRSVVDGVTVLDDATVTSATAAFTATDVGRVVVGVGVPTGATIVSVTSATSVEMSAVATASGSGVTLTLSAFTRVFAPTGGSVLAVDDISTTTDLVIVDNGTTIASTDYQLDPLNGLDEIGNRVPYTHIWRVAGSWYPYPYRNRATVSVTAWWDWLAIPPDVVEACRILGKDIVGLRDTRFGVAGWGEFGVVRMRENPQVLALLEPYVRSRDLVA